jgi:hypothetical protein
MMIFLGPAAAATGPHFVAGFGIVLRKTLTEQKITADGFFF